MKYRATFTTAATVTVDVEVPDELDEFEREDWAADRAHQIASEDIETWGVTTRARLDLSIDGIGADGVEPIESA